MHGRQQLSLFNAHYDTRCFLPVHVYHVESGKPVAVLLRPGKTPSGIEVRTLLKHLVRRITGRAPGSPSGETATTRGERRGGRESTLGSPVKHMFARHGLSRQRRWYGWYCRWPALRSPGAEGASSRGSVLTSSGLS